MRRQEGAVGVVVAALAGLAVVLCLLVTDVAAVVAEREQLATAAEAAALAAAPLTFNGFAIDVDPTRAARDVATANGARLVACRCPYDRSWAPRTVVVQVSTEVDLRLLGRRSLSVAAAAEFRPIALGQR